MTNAIFITVRTSSTRLPNKALLNFQGLPTIEYVIRRMKYSKKTNQIILCTTQKKDDDILIEIAKRNNSGFIQSKIMQFKTNYRDIKLAEEKANILHKAIKKLNNK